MKRLATLAAGLVVLVLLTGCVGGGSTQARRSPASQRPAATQQPAEVAPYPALDASGAHEQKALAALPAVLDAYRKDEPAETQVDVTGVDPQLVAYEVQADMKQADGGGLTIWQWAVLGDRVSDDARLEPVTMTDVQSGLPGVAAASGGEKLAVDTALSAIARTTPDAKPAHPTIVKYWFFYDAGDKGNLLIAVGADGYYRGSSFGEL